MAERLNLQERAELMLICGDNYKTCREAAAIFNERHPEKTVSYSTASRMLRQFKETGNLEFHFKKDHQKSVRTFDNSLNILQSVIEDPRLSVRKRANNFGLSKSTVHSVIKAEKYHPYKPRYVQTLQERDYDNRLEFCLMAQGEIESDIRFPKKILFTDEATFTTNGVVCSQNCRWWSDENPHFQIECKNQYSQRVNVWCGILNKKVIGPYFFQQSLNSERYLDFLRNELENELDILPLYSRIPLWFMQDGAPAHSARTVIQYLDEQFPQKWIGRNSIFPWPARSPDLNPLDYFLWGWLKNKVYSERPFDNLADLENKIRDGIAYLNNNPNILANAINDFNRRTNLCIEREGHHFE